MPQQMNHQHSNQDNSNTKGENSSVHNHNNKSNDFEKQSDMRSEHNVSQYGGKSPSVIFT